MAAEATCAEMAAEAADGNRGSRWQQRQQRHPIFQQRGKLLHCIPGIHDIQHYASMLDIIVEGQAAVAIGVVSVCDPATSLDFTIELGPFGGHLQV